MAGQESPGLGRQNRIWRELAVIDRRMILFENVDQAQGFLAGDREADGVGRAGLRETLADATGVTVVAEFELPTFRGHSTSMATAGPGLAQGQPGAMRPESGRQQFERLEKRTGHGGMLTD
jgi:hypothetical protein